MCDSNHSNPSETHDMYRNRKLLADARTLIGLLVDLTYPSLIHRTGGIGFLRHIEPFGTVSWNCVITEANNLSEESQKPQGQRHSKNGRLLVSLGQSRAGMDG